jgi:hypothetical protein
MKTMVGGGWTAGGSARSGLAPRKNMASQKKVKRRQEIRTDLPAGISVIRIIGRSEKGFQFTRADTLNDVWFGDNRPQRLWSRVDFAAVTTRLKAVAFQRKFKLTRFAKKAMRPHFAAGIYNRDGHG